MNAKSQSQVRPSSTPYFMPAPVSIVQRKCACGGLAGLSGECAKCQKENLIGEKSPLIQPKLKISQPNDKYEQEADRVADEVMRMPENKVLSDQQSEVRKGEELSQTKPLSQEIQRKCKECEEEEEQLQTKPMSNHSAPLVQRQTEEEEDEEDEEEQLQTKPISNQITPLIQRQAEEEEELHLKRLQRDLSIQRYEDEEKILQTERTGSNTKTVSPDIQSDIASLQRSGGRPLPLTVRTWIEPRIGRDFSDIRVYTSSRPRELARSLNARALTIGKGIVFGQGEFQPNTRAGQRLIAHELIHTIQQQPDPRSNVTAQLGIQRAQGSNNSPLESGETNAGAKCRNLVRYGPITLSPFLHPAETLIANPVVSALADVLGFHIPKLNGSYLGKKANSLRNLLQGPLKNDIATSQVSRFKHRAWFKRSAIKQNVAESDITVPIEPKKNGVDSFWELKVEASKVRDAANATWKGVRKSGMDPSLCSGNTIFRVEDLGSRVYSNVESHEFEHADAWREVFCTIVGSWSENIKSHSDPAKAVEVGALFPSIGRARVRNKLNRVAGGTRRKVAGKIKRKLTPKHAAIDRRKGNGFKVNEIRVERGCARVTAVIIPE